MGFFKTTIFLAALTAIFMGAGWALGGSQGLWLALAFAGVMNFGAWWFSDRMVLAQYRARQVDAATAPEFYGIVAELANRAGLPMPKVYIAEAEQPNAFATGRNPANAAVCATTGLLNSLSRAEVRGVMAHELAHVMNRDTLIMTVAATISGALGNLARMVMFAGMGGRQGRSPLGGIGVLVASLLAPLAASLIQFSISRTREFAADQKGAELSGDPLALASALNKLHNGARQNPNPRAEANPASAHIFIVNPLRGGGLATLFSTHPPMEERIARLQDMAGQISGPSSTPSLPSQDFGGPWGNAAVPSSTDVKGPWG